MTGGHTLIGRLTGIHQFALSQSRGGGAPSNILRNNPPSLAAQGSSAKPSRRGVAKFRQRGSSAWAFWAVKEAYRIVLMSDGNSSQTEAPLEAGGNVFPEAQRFIDAITRSRRGISK